MQIILTTQKLYHEKIRIESKNTSVKFRIKQKI